ncbi:MAG TPA: Flp family type IVb pilin [Micromonosporaceae bacterium]|jgi:pilus assembly protein Flp/PilA
MTKLVELVRRVIRRRDEGATAVEYGLLVALIAVVLSIGAFALGQTLNDSFNNTANCVANGQPCGPLNGGGDPNAPDPNAP